MSEAPRNAPFLLTKADAFITWAQKNSLWPFGSGLACCAIEMIATAAARYDIARFGMELFRASPRQADLFIVAGTVTNKMAPVLRRLWEQMPDPKWAMAMGNCAIGGGPFPTYSVLQGVDKIIPVDVYVAGCPPDAPGPHPRPDDPPGEDRPQPSDQGDPRSRCPKTPLTAPSSARPWRPSPGASPAPSSRAPSSRTSSRSASRRRPCASVLRFLKDERGLQRARGHRRLRQPRRGRRRAARFTVLYQLCRFPGALRLAAGRRRRARAGAWLRPSPSTAPPTGPSAKSSTCSASASTGTPTCAASTCPTISRAIRCARTFRSPGGTGGA